MKHKDIAKKNRITQAVLNIVNEEGITSLSFGKIAKQAKVSSGTPYIYYKDKTDMLSNIYVEIKKLMDDGLAKKIENVSSTEDKLFEAVKHFAENFKKYPKERQFMFSLQNNHRLISESARALGMELAKPLFDLYSVAIEQNILKTNEVEIINVMLFAPVKWLIEDNPDVSNEKIQEVIVYSINSIIKDR
ncbi:TetR/AcrR family transcriptional regulator [Mammaliicoccus sp. G-M28]|uniref:TetR/AcrR family transcriptional regulator n=1 Tax=Mammaliicoccus sp. G-M28 TaxID=2898688 RepID=UPI001EFC20B1|nr:TetR/AcrR family transcriptional regulator [Mammaliicoccus sp. G-M28]